MEVTENGGVFAHDSVVSFTAVSSSVAIETRCSVGVSHFGRGDVILRIAVSPVSTNAGQVEVAVNLPSHHELA